MTTIKTILTGFHATTSDSPVSGHFNVGETISHIIAEYPLSDEEKKLITVKPSADLIGVGNGDLIKHIFHNLLKNSLHAIKEANQGEITIWFEKKDNWILLYFKDTATGIPLDQIDKIFDPFYTTKKKAASSIGLGLYFSKLAIQKMLGNIRCDSEKDKYTLFTISFPLADDQGK